MKALIIAGAALALGASAGVAAAHPDDYSYEHQQDHADHQDYHQDQRQLHALAHRLGLADDPESHEALHEALQDNHGQFHDEHPGTRHDHYRYRSYSSPYGGYYGNRSYNYRQTYVQPYGYSYTPS